MDMFKDTALSDREKLVALALGQGRTVSEIADDLDLSVKTISTYRARALAKLNIPSTAMLMKKVLMADIKRKCGL